MVKQSKPALVASKTIGAEKEHLVRDRLATRLATLIPRRRRGIRFTDEKWPRPARTALIVVTSTLLWVIILKAGGVI